MSQPLVREPIGNELGDRDEREIVPRGELLEVRPARHRAVRVQDLADHARGIEPREARQVDARFRLPDPLQHAARPRAQREHMTRPPQVARHGGGIDGHAHRRRTVGGRDPGRHAEAGGGVDAHCERRLARFGVVLRHLREPEGLAALGRERQADQPAPLRRHEIDHLRGDLLGRADQVALVLAVLVVRHDDELPRADVRDRPLYRSVPHSCLTYLPTRSPSTCTRSPTRSSPSVVCARVNGIRAICTRSGPGSALIVRLTPSTVIDPWGMHTSRTPRGRPKPHPSPSPPRPSTRTTSATPSTCPCTRWPPSRTAGRTDGSRLTRRPRAYSANSVRSRVVSTTWTANPPFTRRSTVRHAPFTAMLSPFRNPLYGARIVSVSPVSRFPFPVSRVALATVPTAATIPVNIAACPIPVMYRGRGTGAPPRSSAAPPRAARRACPGRPERRRRRATRAP